jgi:ribonuclease I
MPFPEAQATNVDEYVLAWLWSPKFWRPDPYVDHVTIENPHRRK